MRGGVVSAQAERRQGWASWVRWGARDEQATPGQLEGFDAAADYNDNGGGARPTVAQGNEEYPD